MNKDELETKALFVRKKVFTLLIDLTQTEGITDFLVLYSIFAACFELVKNKAEMNNLPSTALFADVERIFWNVAESAKIIEAKNEKDN